jgi:hypothetical protein
MRFFYNKNLWVLHPTVCKEELFYLSVGDMAWRSSVQSKEFVRPNEVSGSDGIIKNFTAIRIKQKTNNLTN